MAGTQVSLRVRTASEGERRVEQVRADRLSEGSPASESMQARPLTVTATGEQPITQDPDERTHAEASVSSGPASYEPASCMKADAPSEGDEAPLRLRVRSRCRSLPW